MKIPEWETQFKPLSDIGWGIREGQKELGDALIKALNTRTSLIGEAGTGTGKSFVAIIPLIHAIRESEKEGKLFRAVISTETITLQNQIVNKDLPFLESVYGDLKYKKLMGRSNYVCLDAAHLQTVGDLALNSLFMRLEAASSRLSTGERADVESVLNTELSNDEWDAITGSSEFCIDNGCEDTKRCFSTKARKQALTADIVVCNHAILATDVEMKKNSMAVVESDGLLGTYNALIVDEGHRLVPVFASHFTEKINGYELDQMAVEILDGADESKQIAKIETVELNSAIDDVRRVLELAIQYYSYGVEDWNRGEFSFTERKFSSATPAFMDVMTEFEGTTITKLGEVITTLEKHQKITSDALKTVKDGSKWSKTRKGYRKTVKLIEVCNVLRDSLMSSDGIVNRYGMYGVVINGWVSKDGTKRASITLEPLDLSPQIKVLWAGADTSLLMSATLSDPTHKDPFAFIKNSTAFPPNSSIVKVKSPFNFKTQQLSYITKANKPRIALDGARFSFEELYDALLTSKGRSLVLFTARSELEEAAIKLRIKQSKGDFPYRVLVQERDSDKKRLADEFKKDVNSVLLGTDSFMTGFDAPGETLSQVILCKFTMPRYNVQMKQKIAYWKMRGFPEYYQHMALEKFIQAAGRLIRSEECTGVFSLLDQDVMNPRSNVYKTASMGITQLGSPITQDMEEVGRFINGGTIQ